MAEFQKPEFPADAFAGTAKYYARFRPAYPESLFAHLLSRHGGVPREETLLDLACGPGRVTFALAPHFRNVLAIDLEPEMIGEARTIAGARNVSNVQWLTGRAEGLDPPPSGVGMITIGDAYHRVDQARVVANALAWLRAGGSFVVLGSNSLRANRAPWQQSVCDVVQKWTGRPGGGYIPLERITRDTAEGEELLRESGLEQVASFSFLTTISWTIDSLIGYFFSTSHCSRAVLGANADAFADDLREALATETGPQEDWRFGYTYGRKSSAT